MSDAPRQPPPKKDVALALLEESSMFIHLDPRRPDVLVPKGFVGQPQLVLQVGLNMAIPIPDLTIDEAGISCTLSFNRSPFWCRIPWSAVYALVGEDGRGGVWADDVPPEIQQQKAAAQGKGPSSKRPRPKLAAVGSSRPAKDEARDAEQPEPTEPADADDGILAEEPARPPLSAVPRMAPETSGLVGEPGRSSPSPSGLVGEPGKEAQAVRPAPPAGKKAKREIPPYLRVIK